MTLDRAERRNALGPALHRGARRAFGDLGDDDDVRVVVLRGRRARVLRRGRPRVDGGEPRPVAGGERRATPTRWRDAFEAVDACPKAVVARVHGAAFGGGAGLVACADVAVAADGDDVRVLGGAARPDPGDDLAVRAARDRPGRDTCAVHHRPALRRGGGAAARARPRRGLGRNWLEARGGRDGRRAARRRDREAVAACKRLVREATSALVAGRPAGTDRARPRPERRAARVSRRSSSDGARRGPPAPDREPRRDRRPARSGPVASWGSSAVGGLHRGERGSMAAELADVVAPVGSYLDAVGARRGRRRGAGADAVHPGYGFLSEDARFAEAVIAAGLDVGRAAARGDARARRQGAGRARARGGRPGVPVVPGATGDDEALVAAAARARDPVPGEGRGGWGRAGDARRRRSRRPAGARSPRRIEEAAAAFGDDRVFLERRLADARHVEVQILADTHGDVVHLGRARLLAAAASPEGARGVALSRGVRRPPGAARRGRARDRAAAGYESAGTVEFLLLPDGAFRFLEMNARLQVEHPVTEAVTGIDLVHAQLAIADGERVPTDPADLALRGHAIEARDLRGGPRERVPAGGRTRVARLELPRWPGVRIDTALRDGDAITFDFDPLLAKVIAFAEDRTACLARLRAALEATEIVGVPTNLGFLLEVLGHPDVVEGRADTDWIERTWRGRRAAAPGRRRAPRKPPTSATLGARSPRSRPPRAASWSPAVGPSTAAGRTGWRTTNSSR